MEMVFVFIVIISLLLLVCYQHYINTFEPNFIYLRHHKPSIELRKQYQLEINFNNSATITKMEKESKDYEARIQSLLSELDATKSKLKDYEEKDMKIHDLIKELSHTKHKLTEIKSNEYKSLTSTLTSSSALSLNINNTNFNNMCERRFGLNLIDRWRKSEQLWCSNDDRESSKFNNMKSELKCFPYHQEHKIPESFPDMFCTATNFFINFASVYGGNEPPPLEKKAPGLQYYGFIPGSLFSTCTKTDNWYFPHFMPHYSNQVNYCTVS